MPTFTTTSETNASPNETFAFIIDLDQWPLFEGFAMIPAIVRAEREDTDPIGVGTRIEVTNSDGSVHHERITVFEPGTAYCIEMELTPPVSYVMETIIETVRLDTTEGGGTRLVRTFDLRPRSILSAPVAWLVSRFLHRAVRNHNAAVAAKLG